MLEARRVGWLGCAMACAIALSPGIAVAQAPSSEPAAKDSAAAAEEDGDEAERSPAAASPDEIAPEYTAAFDEGLRLYRAGHFVEAIRSFDLALRYEERPGAVYAIAASAREQYINVDRSRAALERALEAARLYLSRAPKGKNAEAARKIVEELEPHLERLARAEPVTSVIITSETEGAWVTLDHTVKGRSSLATEVEPGDHVAIVSAEGYRTKEQKFSVPKGTSYPIRITLEPLPSTIAVRGPSGARVWVDGEPAGTLPLAKPIVVPAGRHWVVVGDEGRTSAVRSLALARGDHADVEVELETTRQRFLAWGALGLGAVGVGFGAGFSAAALAAEADAQDIAARRGAGQIRVSQADDYDVLVAHRDDYRLAAIVGFGAGAAALSTGVLLYLLDEPSPLGGGAAAAGVDLGLGLDFVPPVAGRPAVTAVAGRF